MLVVITLFWRINANLRLELNRSATVGRCGDSGCLSGSIGVTFDVEDFFPG